MYTATCMHSKADGNWSNIILSKKIWRLIYSWFTIYRDLQIHNVGWGTEAEFKVTHAYTIDNNTIQHCSLEIQYVKVVVTKSNSSPSTYLQTSVHVL